MPTRILVYGVCGSGKTTLAKQIGERTRLPWHSVDDLTWEPGWVTVPVEEQRKRIQAICDGAEWILDTAYGQWIDVPLARVELIVALDYPRWISLQRLLRRTTMRVLDKRKICNGNTETIRGTFSKESIIAWHFKAFHRKHERVMKWASQTEGPEVLRFTKPKEVERWLATLDNKCKPLQR